MNLQIDIIKFLLDTYLEVIRLIKMGVWIKQEKEIKSK